MASLFWNAIFGISKRRTTKQMTFLESWDKAGQDVYVYVYNVYKRQFSDSKYDIFWPELDMALVYLSDLEVSVTIKFYAPN